MYYKANYTGTYGGEHVLGPPYASRPDGGLSYPNTVAALATAMGTSKEADNLYNFQQTTGDLLDQEGSTDFNITVLNAQTYSQPNLAKDNCYNFTNSDIVAPASTSAFDLTTSSLSMLLVARFVSGSAVGWIGKRAAWGTGQGYYLRSNATDKARIEVEGSVTEQVFLTADTGMYTDLEPAVVLWGYDDNTGNVYCHIRTNGTTYSVQGAYTSGSMTNSEPFRLGAASSGHAFQARLMAMWEGTKARGMDDANLVESLAAGIGLP